MHERRFSLVNENVEFALAAKDIASYISINIYAMISKCSEHVVKRLVYTMNYKN